MKLLLLSNSTNHGEEFLGYSRKVIADFLKDHSEHIVFIPFAAVSLDWDDYTEKVNQAMSQFNISVKGIHRYKDGKAAFEEATAIMVGGGNSFFLLDKLYRHQLINSMRELVLRGIPYVGWSAGANMACPTLMTTNDMPIVETPTFRTLELIPFQINPHYTEEVIPNHGGESREIRIMEYIEVNPQTKVLGLPEGMMIEKQNGQYLLIGEKGCKVFQHGHNPEWVKDSQTLNRVISC